MKILKHHGLRPADAQLKEYSIISRTFLADACSLCFGISLEEASLLDLVKNDEVRELLKAAGLELSAGNVAEVFTSAGKALACGFSLGWRSRIYSGFSVFALKSVASDRLTRAITNIVEDIGREISLLSLGIEISNYTQFQTLTPAIQRSVSGKWSIQLTQPLSENHDDARWCIDFVIDFMLRAERHI